MTSDGEDLAVRGRGIRRLARLAVGAAVLGAVALAAYIVHTDRAAGTIHYLGRDYIDPATISADEAAGWRPLENGHTRRKGLPLVVPRSELAYGEVPTVVLLRRGDGRYEIYSLSGGP